MDKYLLELLKIENTVIIPGIGALMVTNSKTGSFMFNPHLKFNDHLLEKYVEENSNMDANESVNFVAKYAREIQASLDKGESYSIYGLGSLAKENDEIVFNQDATGGTSKPQPVKSEPIAEAPKKEEAKPEEKKPAATVKSEVVQEKKSTVDEVKATPPINAPTKEKKAEAVNKYTEPKTAKKDVVKESKKEEKSENKVKSGAIPVVTAEQKKEALKEAGMKPSKTMEKAQKDKKPKKKRGVLIVLLLLLLLIGGGGAFLGMNWNKYKSHFAFLGLDDTEKVEDKDTKDANKDSEKDSNSDNSENSVDANENDNSESLDTTDTAVDSSLDTESNEEITSSDNDETVSEPIVEEEVKIVESNDSFESNGSTSKNGDYHVVVGLFSVPENASNLVSKLKGEGHSASILGKFDGMDMVIVKSFSSKQDAINSMRDVRNSIEDRAWVFHY